MISGLFGFGGLAALEIHGIIGGQRNQSMQIIRIFRGNVCVNEREHSLTDRVTGWGHGIVCRLVPPLGLLHGFYQIGSRSHTIGARKSGHFADCPIMFDPTGSIL